MFSASLSKSLPSFQEWTLINFENVHLCCSHNEHDGHYTLGTWDYSRNIDRRSVAAPLDYPSDHPSLLVPLEKTEETTERRRKANTASHKRYYYMTIGRASVLSRCKARVMCVSESMGICSSDADINGNNNNIY